MPILASRSCYWPSVAFLILPAVSVLWSFLYIAGVSLAVTRTNAPPGCFELISMVFCGTSSWDTFSGSYWIVGILVSSVLVSSVFEASGLLRIIVFVSQVARPHMK